MDTQVENKNTITSLAHIISLAFLLGIVITKNLWLPYRDFPLIPVISTTDSPIFTDDVNITLIIILVIALLISILYFNTVLIIIIVILTLTLVFQDINRLQPWVYLYFSLYLLILISEISKKIDFSYFQLPIISIYFWSGVHKFNDTFISITFQSILVDFFKIPSQYINSSVLNSGCLIPIIEIIIGLCLFFPKTRKIGFILSIMTHIFILAFLSPLGINYNPAVYPWNVAMILIVGILFYQKNNVIFSINKQLLKLDCIKIPVLIIFVFLPILNRFGFYDDYPSFSLYSNKNKRFFIAVSEKYKSRLKGNFEDCLLELSPNTEGGIIIDANKWSMRELNIPIYPELRVFKQLSHYFCQYDIPNGDLLFLVYYQPLSDNNFMKWECQ